MDTVLGFVPAATGLLLVGIGLFTALPRRRLDVLARSLFVAGVGVAVLAAGLGSLSGAKQAAAHVARCALALSLAQAVISLALARAAAVRSRATRTHHLERLRG